MLRGGLALTLLAFAEEELPDEEEMLPNVIRAKAGKNKNAGCRADRGSGRRRHQKTPPGRCAKWVSRVKPKPHSLGRLWREPLSLPHPALVAAVFLNLEFISSSHSFFSFL